MVVSTDESRSHATDLKDAKAAAAGDRAARRRVVIAVMDRVRNTAAYLAGPGADAEDMAQIALMEVLRSLHGYAGRGSLRAWANRIAVRSIYAQLRKRAKHRSREPAQSSFDVEGRGADLDGDLDAERVRARVAQALQTLSEPKRAALVMKLVHGYSVEEIADLTGTAFETVRSRLRHARKEFRAAVRDDEALVRYVDSL